MKYALFILPRAQREIGSISKPQRERVKQAIFGLAENPRPVNCKKLSGRPGWRIRVGDYRVVYEIDDEAQSVLVLHVGHRREVYR